MLRKSIYFIIILVNIFFVTACDENDIMKNEDEESINENVENNEEGNFDGIDETILSYDIGLLNVIQNWLNGYYVKHPIVGYNTEGKVEVWAEVSRDLLKSVSSNNTFITESQYYPCFLAYNIMEKLPEVDVIWLYEYDNVDFSLTKLSRNTFHKNFNSALFTDLGNFFSEDREIDKLVEYYYFDEIPDTFEISIEPLERIMEQLFQDSFVGTQVDWAANDDALSLDVYLSNASRQYISGYNSKIAQAFVYSIGLYSTHYWNNILDTHIYFVNEGDSERIVGMHNIYYEDWKNNGLKLSDWCKYSLFGTSEYKELFSVNTSKTEDVLKETETNPDYDEIMEKLKENNIRVLTLGKEIGGYQAILSSQLQTEEELFDNQFNSLIYCMKLPIEKIWFISYVGDKIYISCITRDRYNELTFAGHKLEEYFKPSDWPIISNIYWSKE